MEDKIQWHPAFCGAAELEFKENKNNTDAVFEVSASANKALYEEMRRDPYMCNALREIMKEEMEEEKKIGREIGKEIGRNQLADAITRLRNGEDIDKIKASGIDEETIELARSLI